MKASLVSESVFLRVNSSFPGVLTRLELMFASQSFTVVPELMRMVSWMTTPAGMVALIEDHCPSDTIRSVPRPALSTTGP